MTVDCACSCGNCTDLPVTPFEALRVSYGMLLGEDDFRVLMGNPRGKQQLHSAWLHGSGVVWGYRVATEAPVGGVIERDQVGQPTGLLHETAMGLMNRAMPPSTPDDFAQMITAALKHQLSLGITSSSDCGVSPQLLEVYRAMDARGELPARVNVMPLRRVDGVPRPVPLPQLFESDMLRVSTVKFLADGGLSGATAALSVPYRHADTKGVLRFDR